MDDFFREYSEVIDEIRRRIILVIIVIAAIFLGSYPFMGNVIERVKIDLLPDGASLIYLTPLEVIMLKIKMALVLGVLISIPLVVYLIYRALKENIEDLDLNPRRSFVVAIIIWALIMFVLGSLYSYYIMLPFFLEYVYADAVQAGAIATYSLYQFIMFIALTTVIFGAVFELPIILTILVRTGLVRYASLVYYRRHAYIVMFVTAAMITGPDIISQFMIAVPLIVFYEISLVVVRVTARNAVKEEVAA